MSRDTIKYIALFTMLLNHIGIIFLNPPISTVFIDIGYFTAITMCYFLVEGYRYTRSRKKYAERLLLFAILSQLPYQFAFHEDKLITLRGLDIPELNMLFNLLFCFLLLCIWDQCHNQDLKGLLTLLLVLLCVICDWSLLAPAFVYLFYNAGEDRDRQKKAWLLAMALFGMVELLDGLESISFALAVRNVLYALSAVAGQMAAALCILYAYNGKKAEKYQNFSKWFCYLFYPAHLIILGIIRMQIG